MVMATLDLATSHEVRRSKRVANRITQYRESSDSEQNDEHGEIESTDDQDFDLPSSRKRVRDFGKSSRSQQKRGRGNKGHKLNARSLEELEAELPDNTLFRALSYEEVDVKDITLEWLESYENDEDHESITLLINFLLRSAGSVHLFQPHDLANLESASETVSEMSIAFSEQHSHRYPFKTLPPFRKNVVKFFEELVNISHEKGLLYKQSSSEDKKRKKRNNDESFLSSSLMKELLTWISLLSSCQIRPLRYISTIVLFTIQSQLSEVINSVISSLEKLQRQMSRISKNGKQKKKREDLGKTIDSFFNQKDTILEYFDDISNSTLMQRYRDIDPLVRQECMRHLSSVMVTYPDYFFQATFLRFFGWLLSDPSAFVRLEVCRVLLRLYRNANNKGKTFGIGFRQFTERYKKQVIKMSLIDSDVHVKISCVGICCELLRVGFLDEPDIAHVISNFFHLINDTGGSITNSSNEKLKLELARFISIANAESTKVDLEKFSLFLERHKAKDCEDAETNFTFKNCFKYRNLITMLSSAFELLKKDFEFKINDPISIIFRYLNQIPLFSGSWEFLIRYFLFDVSSIRFEKHDETTLSEKEVEEFRKLIELSEDVGKYLLLEFILGALYQIYDSKKLKSQNDVSDFLVKFVGYLPKIVESLVKSDKLFLVVLPIFTLTLNSSDDKNNIYSLFINLNQEGTFNELIRTILKYFRDFDDTRTQESEIFGKFETFLERLLLHYNSAPGINSSHLNVTNSHVRMDIQALTQDLVEELKQSVHEMFKSDDQDIFNAEIGVQKLVRVSKPMIKLNMLGELFNINSYIETNSFNLVDQLFNNLANINMQDFIEESNIYLKYSSGFMRSLKAMLDLLLLTNSWKLEELLFVPNSDTNNNEQARYNLVQIFGHVDEHVKVVLKMLSQIGNIIQKVRETYGTSSAFFTDSKLLTKKCNDLRTLFATKIIDLLTSFKIFYMKFKNHNQFVSFVEFFEELEEFGVTSRILLPSVENSLSEIFLYKESRLAKLLNTELERNSSESAIWDTPDYEDKTEEARTSFFDSDHDEDDNVSEDASIVYHDVNPDIVTQVPNPTSDADKQNYEEESYKKSQEKWEAERELSVYTIKLLALINLSMVLLSFQDRIRLNSDKLGTLFQSILSQKPLHSV